ncbi:PEGA domain-containing protein [Pelagicoccus sp. SDUM812005]|uniref:PEGA domain-containing protein n=1 Tax=Pelagicoccus sp. SDUM812005 TaxID=3041257 RepID=UPI00280E1BF1|nr:PEGA domain-containing protein [Pelagicoccus sp. SDUM812005]MDQ8179618.1 PEGA domain-containing protein [Pelagicoccus sp. SDUM812005]
MPSVTRPEKDPQPIDARARIRKSEKSSRWFAVLFWVAGLGGVAFCYWYYAQVYVPGERAKLQLAETQAYARELRGVVASLGEWSTQESFDRVREQLVAFDAREDASLAVRSQLWDRFSEAYEPRAQRMREFDRMLAEVRAFSLEADEESLLVMQERVRQASGRFEQPLMQQLKEAWAPKREAIAQRLDLYGSGGTGALEVRSIPTGARLFLNDREVGVTPLQASGMRAGKLKLSLKHPKYYDYDYPIRIKEYGVLSLTDLEMKPRQGGVEITVVGGSTGDRVEVELVCTPDNGETFDYVKSFEGVYVSVPQLIIGAYDISVYVNGRLRQSTKLEVLEGSVSRWTARL